MENLMEAERVQFGDESGQPLTFTLNGYPNPLKETVSLSIRK
jgi:hypothetical protein